MKEVHDLEYWKEYRKNYSKNYYKTHKEQYKEYKSKHKEKYNKPCYDKKGRPRKSFDAEAYRKEYYLNNKEKYNTALKFKFLAIYGEKCECCGESSYEFLCLDHKMGKDRKYKDESGGKAYRRAIKEYDPKEYRTLCANCNQATRYGHICPHKLINGEKNNG